MKRNIEIRVFDLTGDADAIIVAPSEVKGSNEENFSGVRRQTIIDVINSIRVNGDLQQAVDSHVSQNIEALKQGDISTSRSFDRSEEILSLFPQENRNDVACMAYKIFAPLLSTAALELPKSKKLLGSEEIRILKVSCDG